MTRVPKQKTAYTNKVKVEIECKIELIDQRVSERTKRHDLVKEVQGCRDWALLILSRSATVDNDDHK